MIEDGSVVEMTEYKCIACGYLKESESECTCPECGYKMFPADFERREILLAETQRFINGLLLGKVQNGYLSFYRKKPVRNVKNAASEPEYETILKSSDDARFPDFYKIRDYVYSADKTEEFINRLNYSLEKIKQYVSTAFQMDYLIDYTLLEREVGEREKDISNAVSLFGADAKFKKIEFPETKVSYSQIPDENLLSAAENLLCSLKELSNKIYKFIRQNNIYGIVNREKFHSKFKCDENTDYLETINKTNAKVCQIIKKKYQPDIFSDGADEQREMLRILWNGIEIVMSSPILVDTYLFEFKGKNYTVNRFYGKLRNYINGRYSEYYNTVFSPNNFTNKSEDELFDIYNDMIKIDSRGILGLDPGSLLLPGKYEKELRNLIGLSGIKESIQKIKAYAIKNKKSGNLNLHMCFYGNPGTGKTEVARIIAGILYENDILPTKNVVEVSRGDLVGQYVGETPQKTMQKINEAMGGVLFIDEAYALAPKGVGFDYGHEAVATLIKAMEDNRGKFCIILAGYKNQMLDLISANPGFKSRIQFELEFPNYTRDELKSIAGLMLEKRGYTITDSAIHRILDITDAKRREPNFANAREIRNILDGAIMCQNLRSINTSDTELGIADVNKYIEDARINLPFETNSPKILTAEEELDSLVGLDSVKRMVRKIKAFAKKNKNDPYFNMHMCFYGNPGTGKTEVARIISSVLYESGVLPEAKLVETDPHGLIGNYVGETAPKTQAKIMDAMGGVLFIDEAYGLVHSDGGSTKSYGDEAIEVLLKNMEDYSGKFCVILAGYKDETKYMIKSNPGLESKIQFVLEFSDYSREELGKIAVKFLEKKKYTIDIPALDLLLDITDYYRSRDNFANARTVRNILDQVIMNQNLRTEDSKIDDNNIIKSDVEDYLSDEGLNLNDKSDGCRRIGFI